MFFLDGKVNAVVMSTGTGGTLAGVSMFLKEKNSKIRTVLADPPGSVLYHYIKSGKLDRTDGSSITEGLVYLKSNISPCVFVQELVKVVSLKI
jgi:cysteine synthase A